MTTSRFAAQVRPGPRPLMPGQSRDAAPPPGVRWRDLFAAQVRPGPRPPMP